MEESEVMLLSYDALQTLKATYPAIDQIDRLSKQRLLHHVAGTAHLLQFHSAQERYEDLLRNEPHLVQNYRFGVPTLQAAI